MVVARRPPCRLLRAFCLALALAPASSHPEWLLGCAQPSSALGPHGAPAPDDAATAAFVDAASGGVLRAGAPVNVTLTPAAPSRGLVLVTAGRLGGASGCASRRLNLETVEAVHSFQWTPSAPGDALSVTFVSAKDGAFGRATFEPDLAPGPPLPVGAVAAAPPPPPPPAGGMDGMAMPAGAAPHVHAAGGSWAGHAIPAFFFLLWGTWWAGSTVAAVSASAASRQRYAPRAWYPLPRALGGGDAQLRRLEPLLKVALPSFGAFCELYFHPPAPRFNAMHLPGSRAFDEAHVKFWQHALMYAFFVLAGCVDLLAARSLPPAAPLAALSLAFAGEALLFWFHLGTQEGLLRLAHLLLVVAIAGCAAAAAAEAAGGGGPVAALARCLFTLLQGSWFLQIGRVWYSSDRGWVNDGAAEMILPVYFCIHVIGWCAVLLALNGAWVQWAHGATLEARGGRLYADERGGGGGGGGEGGAPRLAKAHGCMSCTGDEE